ncbi:hypothetical protein HDU84_005169 [Entophlyctis sp. JEL0112]|nr:hypothetical protein HDU84_005169 [Entophlyctis sp. JEL0112]
MSKSTAHPKTKTRRVPPMPAAPAPAPAPTPTSALGKRARLRSTVAVKTPRTHKPPPASALTSAPAHDPSSITGDADAGDDDGDGADDDDDDLCPVCDGVCTCKRTPVASTQLLRLHLATTPSDLKPGVNPNPAPNAISAHTPSLRASLAASDAGSKAVPPRAALVNPSKNLTLPAKAQNANTRMIHCTAEVVLDEDGNMWKRVASARTPKKALSDAAAKEFTRMSVAPTAKIRRTAPTMTYEDGKWIVAADHDRRLRPLTGFVTPNNLTESLLFNSSPAKVSDSLSSTSSSDLDNGEFFVYSSGSESDGKMSDSVVFEEYQQSDVATDDSSSGFDSDSNPGGSDWSPGWGKSSQTPDDDDIDVIFAAADDSDDGLEASESDVEMFVENALYGWSSSDESDIGESEDDSESDSSEAWAESFDSFTPERNGKVGNSVNSLDFNDDLANCLNDTLFDVILGAGSSNVDVENAKRNLDFLDSLPSSSDGDYFGLNSSLIDAEIGQNTSSKELSAIPILSPPQKKASFEITKVGPNGELTTVTKQLKLSQRHMKPGSKRKAVASSGIASASRKKLHGADDKADGDVDRSENVEAQAQTVSQENNRSKEESGKPAAQASALPNGISPAIITALKSALTAANNSKGSLNASQPNVLNALMASLKSIGADSSGAFNALLELKRTLSKPTKRAEDDEGSDEPTTAANIAALAVIAAAVAAAKGKSARKAEANNSNGNTLESLSQPTGIKSPRLQSKKEKIIWTVDDFFDTDAFEYNVAEGCNNGDDEDSNDDVTKDVFSRWSTRVPIGTYRQGRRQSFLSKGHSRSRGSDGVSRNLLKKAFKSAKNIPQEMTLPSSPFGFHAAATVQEAFRDMGPLELEDGVFAPPRGVETETGTEEGGGAEIAEDEQGVGVGVGAGAGGAGVVAAQTGFTRWNVTKLPQQQQQQQHA